MALLLEPSTASCIELDFGSTAGDAVLVAGMLAIPAVAIPLVARFAKRHPSRALARGGRRQRGDWIFRLGLAISGIGVLGFTGALIVGIVDPDQCDNAGGALAFLSVLLALVGALLIGGGWAYAVRANWVVLATIAVLDVWIFYIFVAVSTAEQVHGLLLLAFAIHGGCISVAASWSYKARDLGPIERAKAGEAGRGLAAVWVFLASYSTLALFREENGIFETAAGSAVTGALTLGALAVTMGSGFTKYAEAINAPPPPEP